MLVETEHVHEAGLPEHIVHLYLTQAEERMNGRRSRIVKQAIQNSPKISSPSSALINDSLLVSKEMRHAKRLTPSQRKTEAVKLKLRNEMRDDTSSESGGERDDNAPLRKRKKTSDEAQEAHKDGVQQILKQIEEKLKN
ncbi:hypothetical protein AC249_AIPGENE23186 [Exaiptasia diaphana]|nr:hypothetical protein AC249_AIPGENE23186 [Exaiptasia diaphana]